MLEKDSSSSGELNELENHFESGSVYSKADALPSALEQIVVFQELTDAKEDFLFTTRKQVQKGESIAPRAGLSA
jgi:hypothetical protein